VFEVVKTASGYASTPTTLVRFGSADGANPRAGLIADDKGNLFGTTTSGGANNDGTVFEIRKTAHGYANTPTTLVSFNGADGGGANPSAGVIMDANGNLFGTTASGGAFGGADVGGTVFEITKTAHGYANTPTILVSFCALADCADGNAPGGGLIIDAEGNLFGTTQFTAEARGANLGKGGTVFEVVKTASGYASTPTTLVSFNGADGANPVASLIMDAKGNLFGTTYLGGTPGLGTVFEVVKTASGYASTPTTLVSFCALANCADGDRPQAGLIADAHGNLFGTTTGGGTNGHGTVFEVTGSGFAKFAGTPGKPNCFGKSISALARQYGGLNAAAEALGYPSVRALQKAILEFCEG
jgi:uncharacterized repeat protein (TIGR03803 family)